MRFDRALQSASEGVHAWGGLPHSREDLIAEGVALVALLFSVAVGVVIALLPVSADAKSHPAIVHAAHHAPAAYVRVEAPAASAVFVSSSSARAEAS
jgi:hypothetical protein